MQFLLHTLPVIRIQTILINDYLPICVICSINHLLNQHRRYGRRGGNRHLREMRKGD
jgi:hypothetical protein